MDVPSVQQLEMLKYNELRRLAKTEGLRANLKTDKLLKALTRHFRESAKAGNMVPSEMKENEDFQDTGSGKMLNQNENLANNRVTDDYSTPGQQKERKGTRQKIVEGKTPMGPLSGKKPQYTASLPKSGRTTAITPNFKKLHEAQFNKMESIDNYAERKNKMIKNCSSSVNKVKMVKNNYLKTSRKGPLNSNTKSGSSFRGILFSPHPQENSASATSTPPNLRRSLRGSLCSANKSILSRKLAFSSNNLSTNKMNVRFSEETKDNEQKRSLTKTPSRKSPFPKVYTPDNQKSQKTLTRKNFSGSTTKCELAVNSSKAAVTPFKFVAQTMEPTSAKKTPFDLKASLSRPLTYQPHRGKLKPWSESKENMQNVGSRKRNYKQPLLQTRDDRRHKHEQERKQRKSQVLETRRRLTVL